MRRLHEQVHYYPNVVDIQHFRGQPGMKRPSDLPSGHRKIIGYHGALSDYKINFELFLDVINLNQIGISSSLVMSTKAIQL